MFRGNYEVLSAITRKGKILASKTLEEKLMHGVGDIYDYSEEVQGPKYNVQNSSAKYGVDKHDAALVQKLRAPHYGL